MISPAIKIEVLKAMRPNRDKNGKRIKRTLRKGAFERRVIAQMTVKLPNGGRRETYYHATKGWRTRRV